MSVFGVTLIVAVILFIREEILSSVCRKELVRANEEYEAYRLALKREMLLMQELPAEGVLEPCLVEEGRCRE